MSIRIDRVSQDAQGPHYIVSFSDHAERARWLHRNDFRYSPIDNLLARWTCSHNGADFRHTLELIPYAEEHYDNLRALHMKCFLHKKELRNDRKRPTQEGNLKRPEIFDSADDEGSLHSRENGSNQSV